MKSPSTKNESLDRSLLYRDGFRGYGGFAGTSVWMHNPEHRLEVPYANSAVAGRSSRPGFAGSGRTLHRSALPAQQRFGAPGFEQRGWTANPRVFSGYHNGGMTRMQSDRGFRSMGAGRTFGGGGGMRGGGRR